MTIDTILEADIPAAFWTVPYDGARFGTPEFGEGANCQAFAYALLRRFGLAISDFRSSDLWNDTVETETVSELAPLDLLLFNGTADPYGAHIGVYLGEGRVIHLSRRVGKPTVWPFERFASEAGYEVFIGAKRACLSAATGSS